MVSKNDRHFWPVMDETDRWALL